LGNPQNYSTLVRIGYVFSLHEKETEVTGMEDFASALFSEVCLLKTIAFFFLANRELINVMQSWR
jgi:hypothetical protein